MTDRNVEKQSDELERERERERESPHLILLLLLPRPPLLPLPVDVGVVVEGRGLRAVGEVAVVVQVVGTLMLPRHWRAGLGGRRRWRGSVSEVVVWMVVDARAAAAK